jgi:phenylacetate-coenzyme A ligase PaaK-like adenylate-forming protein
MLRLGLKFHLGNLDSLALSMSNPIEHLIQSDPFDFSKKSIDLFIESFKYTANIHYKGNNFFKYLWDQDQLSIDDIKTQEDLEKAPFIMVNLFKHKSLVSCPKEEIVLTLGSSGTGGQKSLMHLNQFSLDSVKELAFNIHKSLGMTSAKKYNYLCFTYDPKVANDLGTAFTDELLTSFTGIEDVFYAIQFDEKINDFKLNEKETIQKLIEYSNSSYPTRILGFPAFLYKIIKENNIKLNFCKDSWIQTGGGWKGQADKEIPKKEFKEFMFDRLNIPIINNRDLFGMVEHGIPYVDCDNGRLRVPNFARIFIRDPKTLKVLPIGETGLIQFMCTYNTSYPSMNILSTDWGRLQKETDDLGGYSLEIIGRAGIDKHKGCALKALEIIGN